MTFVKVVRREEVNVLINHFGMALLNFPEGTLFNWLTMIRMEKRMGR